MLRGAGGVEGEEGGYFIRCTPSNGARAAFTDRSWHVNLRRGGGGGGGDGRVGSKTRKSFN